MPANGLWPVIIAGMARSYNQPKNQPGHQALRKRRVSLPNHVYLLTATTLNRQCFFAEFNAGCAASRCFENGKILGDARMLAWVLMQDHVHWLVNLGDQNSLSMVVNLLKSSSSRLANLKLDRPGRFGNRGTMIMPYAPRRIYSLLPGILLPILYGQDWLSG